MNERVNKKMYIDISLCKNMTLLESIKNQNNSSYLCKNDELNFPCLSEVETMDKAFFNYEDMEKLIEELQRVKLETLNSDDQAHVDYIIHLAKRCQKDHSTVLVFEG